MASWSRTVFHYSMDYLRGLKQARLPVGPGLKEHLLNLGLWRLRTRARGTKAGRHFQRKPTLPYTGNICKYQTSKPELNHSRPTTCKSVREFQSGFEESNVITAGQLSGVQAPVHVPDVPCLQVNNNSRPPRVLIDVIAKQRREDPVNVMQQRNKDRHPPSFFLCNARSVLNKMDEFETVHCAKGCDFRTKSELTYFWTC